MKKQCLTGLLVIILTVGLVFTACDLIQAGTGGTTSQETFDPLVITGKDSEGSPVIVKFSRPATGKQALTPSTLKDKDTYEIFHNSVLVSSGTITISGGTVTFTPASGNPFLGTVGSSGGVSTVTLPNGVIPSSTGGTIAGFVPDGGSNNGNSSSDAKAVAALLGSNAEASGSTVVIKGDITVRSSINIPSGVKLVFNTNNNDFYIVNYTVSVAAGGGIEVPSGKSVNVVGAGALIVEGKSTINGRLNVGRNYDTGVLDISGGGTVFTIDNGGVLSVLGGETVSKVGQIKYEKSGAWGTDAVFKLSASLIVEKGGRFFMPDPTVFDVSNITGGVRVKAGGELILITADANGEEDLHPVIGTITTSTQGFPEGADYVMDPISDSRIDLSINSGVPALELTGNATALGRLVIEQKMDKSESTPTPLDGRKPPYRLDVWLLYPLTVTETSVLQVGNSVDLFTSLFITGAQHPIPGLKRGLLTNNNRITIFDGSGIVEWFGGYFNWNARKESRVADQRNSNIPGEPFRGDYYPFTVKNNTSIDFKLWRAGKWEPYGFTSAGKINP